MARRGKAVRAPGRDPGYCLYCARLLIGLLPDLHSEIEGVRAGRDIEYVHRMRVASRRVRAALPLLEGCVGDREFRRWLRRIRRITRTLGAARDIDVQIDFLLSYAGRLPEHSGPAETGLRVIAAADGSVPPGMSIRTHAREALPATTVPSLPDDIRQPLFPGFRRLLARFAVTLKRRREIEAQLPDPARAAPSGQQGIECLLLRLEQERERLQPDVVSLLDAMGSPDLLEEMAGRFRTLEIRLRLEGADPHSAPVYDAAYLQSMIHIDGLRLHAPALADPTQVDAHHEMRIAAKRFRYTLEAFGTLFDDGLKGELKVLKRLQDLLGEVHDCDVWLEMLPIFLEEERTRTIAYFGHDGFFLYIEPGIRHLIEDRRAERTRIHARAVEYWNEVQENRYLEHLEERLLHARDETMKPPADLEHLNEGTGSARIALIADVHGNLPALEAVIADAKMRGATGFINAGDLVGYGFSPNEVIRRLREVGSIDVAGNLDRKVVKTARKGRRVPDDETTDPARVAWTAGVLSSTQLAYLEDLPSTRRFMLRGVRLLVTHIAPEGGKDGILPDLPDDRVPVPERDREADVVILGHTHRPMARTVRGVRFLNPGSVGRSEAGTDKADYALLQLFPFDICHFSISLNRGEETAPDSAAPAPISPGDYAR
ncbi:MAG: CHAD domain-containing protein [Methanospirillum sp.]